MSGLGNGDQLLHAIVLAGGTSRRMGTRKELLDMNGEPNLLRQCRQLLAIADEITVVTDANQKYSFLPSEVSVVRDLVPDRGPIGGICTGMARSGAELQLIAGCDYPLVRKYSWEYLVRQIASQPEADAVIPEALGKLHPLCAIYRRSTLPVWEASLNEGSLRVMDAVNRMNAVICRIEGPEEAAYVNMNVPDDYRNVKEWLI